MKVKDFTIKMVFPIRTTEESLGADNFADVVLDALYLNLSCVDSNPIVEVSGHSREATEQEIRNFEKEEEE